MNINNLDVPKSTLFVAGILWSVLAALMTWNLIATLNIKEQQAKDLKEVMVDQAKMNGRIDVLETRVEILEHRK